MEKEKKLTPLMRQYHDIKATLPDALLLFQVGDFYELFFDDAKKASAFLGITLTKRGHIEGEPIPLCGVPLHAINYYLSKLVKGGFKVAICDQIEEPKPGKVVDRKVIQVLTPGTLTDSNLLDEKSASYLFSFFPIHNSWGLLFAELLTGQIFATVLPSDSTKTLEAELIRFYPDEILIPDNKIGRSFGSFLKKMGYFITLEKYEEIDIYPWLDKNFNSDVIKQINSNDALKAAIINFYCYIKKTQEGALDNFKNLFFYKTDDFLILDSSTQRNLELVQNCQDGSRKNSLFELLDYAKTSMGSRMIKKWILRPLIKKEIILQRQDVIEYFVKNISILNDLENKFENIGDLERIVGRIALNKANLNDYLALLKAFEYLPSIKELLSIKELHLILLIRSMLGDFSSLENLLRNSLNDNSSKDWLIKKGFDLELDRLRDLVENSNQKIIELEKKEQRSTGINSLKIRYNQVQGYYVEVTKPNLHLVPEYYQRHQTLVNKERFTTRELRDLQVEIFRARNEISQVEKEVFEKIKKEVILNLGDLRKLSQGLANLDALLGLSFASYSNGFCRPLFNEKREILIKNGRHPVIEKKLQNSFIPNSTSLTDQESLWIITGPNMGGKSTYLRQVALICIMSQCGVFVPAESANLHILDRVFTRIGAGDNLSEGKSTFLVEMEETALICNQATKNSLVILDEVGRGTSTFDGLAIAQAVVEHIYIKIRARCLFATHYHELTLLSNKFIGIKSYYASSKKTENGILFLYKIINGIADGSFGLEVAKLAELPSLLIERAEEILHNLSNKDLQQASLFTASNSQLIKEREALKLKLIDLEVQLKGKNKLLSKLDELDFDNLSPKKAMDLIWELKN